MDVEELTEFFMGACIECGAITIIPDKYLVGVPHEEYGTVLTVKAGPHAGKAARCPLHGDEGFPLRQVSRDDAVRYR